MRIPTKLRKQPVIEAAFEIRYSRETQVSEIVPGFLFHALGCTKPVISMPPSQIPKNVREQDDQLHYAVVSRLEFEGYHIGLSDHGIIISTNIKYEGWTEFCSFILTVYEQLNKLLPYKNIIRYSLKYIDFFKEINDESLFGKLNMDITMAGESMSSYPLSLRLDGIDGEFINTIQVVSHALVLSEGDTYDKKGLILDIETSKSVNDDKTIQEFNINTKSLLDELHECNKLTFFKCLKESTIQELEPVYAQ